MKATELMIGDLVLQSNGNAVKIDWIKTGEYGYYDKYGKMEIACTPLLEPIPLTAEILEKNGFKVTKESKMLVLTIAACYELNNEAEYPNKYWIIIDDFSDDEKIRMSFNIQYPKKIHQLSGLRIAYVHELQHALRLCGLNELASNFKV